MFHMLSRYVVDCLCNHVFTVPSPAKIPNVNSPSPTRPFTLMFTAHYRNVIVALSLLDA